MSEVLARQLMELFDGSAHKRGHSQPKGVKRTSDGKQETENWMADGPASLEHWSSHLEGKLGLGVIPIRKETNDCKFGAIDIDVYSSQKTLEDINKAVREANIPLVVCRSKSGGAHLFLFTSEWVPAQLIREKLEFIASYLGYANAEIFPAQASLGEGTSDGNFINMPYFGPNSMRYALRADNQRMEIPEFIESAQRVRLSSSQLENLGLRESNEDLFPGGPPCLECNFRLAKRGTPIADRNTLLQNCAVYANLRWPGKENSNEREGFLFKLNGLLPNPLPLEELAKTVLASDKKGKTAEYKFQCKRQPLKGYCNAAVCRNRQWGIGAYNGSVVRTLTKVHTNPPLWILSINDKKVQLTTEELYQYTLLQKRVMEEASLVLNPQKQTDWVINLKEMMEEMHNVYAFRDSNDTSDIIEKIYLFLYDRASSTTDNASIQDILNKSVFLEDGKLYFIPEFLYEYLKIKPEQRRIVDSILAQYYEAKECRPNLTPRRRCFAVPEKYKSEPPVISK